MTTLRPLLSALLSLACAACTTVEAAPPPDLGPLVHVDFSRSAADLAALGDVTELFKVSEDLPAGYQIVDTHITVPQRLHFTGSLASSSMVVVDCLDDGGQQIGSYMVDDVHGGEGQRGGPAMPLTHGEEWPNPLGVAFRVGSLHEDGSPGAPFSALVSTGPYASTGFTVRTTLRRAGTIVNVP